MPRSNHSKPDELAELVTADHEFKSVEKEIKINWLK